MPSKQVTRKRGGNNASNKSALQDQPPLEGTIAETRPRRNVTLPAKLREGRATTPDIEEVIGPLDEGQEQPMSSANDGDFVVSGGSTKSTNIGSIPSHISVSNSERESETEEIELPQKKKRGRPPKIVEKTPDIPVGLYFFLFQ